MSLASGDVEKKESVKPPTSNKMFVPRFLSVQPLWLGCLGLDCGTCQFCLDKKTYRMRSQKYGLQEPCMYRRRNERKRRTKPPEFLTSCLVEEACKKRHDDNVVPVRLSSARDLWNNGRLDSVVSSTDDLLLSSSTSSSRSSAVTSSLGEDNENVLSVSNDDEIDKLAMAHLEATLREEPLDNHKHDHLRFASELMDRFEAQKKADKTTSTKLYNSGTHRQGWFTVMAEIIDDRVFKTMASPSYDTNTNVPIMASTSQTQSKGILLRLAYDIDTFLAKKASEEQKKEIEKKERHQEEYAEEVLEEQVETARTALWNADRGDNTNHNDMEILWNTYSELKKELDELRVKVRNNTFFIFSVFLL